MDHFGEADSANWSLEEEFRKPSPIVPVPASSETDIRGLRVVVGVPGFGWRCDLRADSPTIQGSRTYVPVLPEHEWYRAEAEQTEVFAPLVPIESVWVEKPLDDKRIRETQGTGLASLDMPPTQHAIPAARAARIFGRRVVYASGTDQTEQTHQRDLRAVTEIYVDGSGGLVLRLSRELDWYRWAWNGKIPRTFVASADDVWLE